ncbi:MAG: pyridoxamine 5'-phosphate oxidase family protein [Clostridia bacterium]|nr:pyridoxamine 5'-phosphate oxidase family protein [Clostridia bacterium]
MIRSEKEIKDLNDICRIIGRSKALRLGLNTDSGWPYVVPLSFGFELDGTDLIFYVHGARQGLKWELADRDNRVTVEIDNMFGIIDGPPNNPCEASTAYDSVIGQGTMTRLEERHEKEGALVSICAHYGVDVVRFPDHMLASTAAWKIRVPTYTAKRNLAATR